MVDIKQIVSNIIKQYLYEDKNVKFNGNTFPTSGWCYFIVGGPGSGKNYFIENNFLMNGKIFDIDDVTEKFTKLIKSKKIPGGKVLGREMAINSMDSMVKNFFKAQTGIKGNIIFNCCGQPGKKGELSLMELYGNIAKNCGYKLGICWVINNRSTALLQNIRRNRTIPDKSLHTRFNKVNDFLPKFLTSSSANIFDEAYLFFKVNGVNIQDENEVVDNQAVKLEKSTTGFILDDEIVARINNVNGPNEKSKNFTPITYMSSKDIRTSLSNGDNLDNFIRESIKVTIKNMLNETRMANINESLTDTVYHFTNIQGLLSILKYNVILLSNSFDLATDRKLNKNYDWYLSLTREYNSMRGYPGNQNAGKGPHESGYCCARIHFDGRKLNTIYKGGAVNYHHLVTNNKQQKNITNPNDAILLKELMFSYHHWIVNRLMVLNFKL